MENKLNKDIFMTVFFMSLVNIALCGLAIKTAQHELGYTQLQWLAGIGLLFMIVFCLSIIDGLIGLTIYFSKKLGLNEEKEKDCKCKDTIEKLNKQLKSNDNKSEVLKEDNKMLQNQLDETVTDFSTKIEDQQTKITELKSICEQHQLEKNELSNQINELKQELAKHTETTIRTPDQQSQF